MFCIHWLNLICILYLHLEYSCKHFQFLKLLNAIFANAVMEKTKKFRQIFFVCQTRNLIKFEIVFKIALVKCFRNLYIKEQI